jgi:hypothetical protein
LHCYQFQLVWRMLQWTFFYTFLKAPISIESVSPIYKNVDCSTFSLTVCFVSPFILAILSTDMLWLELIYDIILWL